MGLFRRHKVQDSFVAPSAPPADDGTVGTSFVSPSGDAPGAVPRGGEVLVLTVQDVFSISGRGTVVTGQVASGQVSVGDVVTIHSAQGEIVSKVTGLEMFRRKLDYAQAGDNVGMLLEGINREQVQRGDAVIGQAR